jgi:Xaa-Pro dipeptidase
MLFNKDRALHWMNDCGLDALIATTPTNITYFTDYSCWVDPLFKDYMMVPGGSDHLSSMYAACTSAARSCLVVAPVFVANATDVWIDDIRTFGTGGMDISAAANSPFAEDQRLCESICASAGIDTATQALVAWLKNCGLEDGCIGIEMSGLRPDAEAELRRLLPGAQLKDCTNLVRIIRMVKSAEEIDILRTAAQISEDAGMAVLDLVKPGVDIEVIIQAYREQIAARGADFDHYAYSIRGNCIATHAPYVFEKGSYHFIDYGVIYKGYFSDTGLTLCVGEPSAEVRADYQALCDCQAAAVAEMRPGVKSSTLANAMHASLAEKGIKQFPHGHGVGIEIRDYPIIVPDNDLRITDDCIDLPSDLPLEENMAVNLEVSILKFGKGATQHEQSMLVTSDGCEQLIPIDRSDVFVRG